MSSGSYRLSSSVISASIGGLSRAADDLTVDFVAPGRARQITDRRGWTVGFKRKASRRLPHRLFDRAQSLLGLGAVRPAGLRHVGTAAAAFAAERRGGDADDIHGV